ncbi:hypothetical protein BGY98DRAFT_937076 [Russula aff. rugulosa BPL654]|nr:hypothetical protein BGY98DRAFT_937076 [Russula aff. rugulosa BPL654]
MSSSLAPSTASKEKGNAAFKAGDYAAAIGHYTAAVLADPSEPTFFLNRAAAYLKLSKNEDAERDCTTVLVLSNKNVKALFRRAQARTALQKLGEAHNALKLEPNNEAVKAELSRVDELIVSRKGKTLAPRLPNPFHTSTSTTASRCKLDPIPPAPAVPKPAPASFREAKQVREVKSAGRVGGGIFRVSGNDTVFKTRSNANTGTGTIAYARSISSARTLFEFTRAWDSIPSSDTDARWALLNSIHPTSLPVLFGVSLDFTLLASFIPVLAGAASADRDAVRKIMCSLAQVSRFRTVVQFLSRAERNAARVVWTDVVRDTGDGSAEGVEEAARMWGFTEA